MRLFALLAIAAAAAAVKTVAPGCGLPEREQLSTCSPFKRRDQSGCTPKARPLSPLAANVMAGYLGHDTPKRYLRYDWNACCGLGNSLGAVYGSFLLARLLNRTWIHNAAVFSAFKPPPGDPSTGEVPRRGWDAVCYREQFHGKGASSTQEYILTNKVARAMADKGMRLPSGNKTYDALERLLTSDATVLVVREQRILPYREWMGRVVEAHPGAMKTLDELFVQATGMHPSGIASMLAQVSPDIKQLTLRAPITREVLTAYPTPALQSAIHAFGSELAASAGDYRRGDLRCSPLDLTARKRGGGLLGGKAAADHMGFAGAREKLTVVPSKASPTQSGVASRKQTSQSSKHEKSVFGGSKHEHPKHEKSVFSSKHEGSAKKDGGPKHEGSSGSSAKHGRGLGAVSEDFGHASKDFGSFFARHFRRKSSASASSSAASSSGTGSNNHRRRDTSAASSSSSSYDAVMAVQIRATLQRPLISNMSEISQDFWPCVRVAVAALLEEIGNRRRAIGATAPGGGSRRPKVMIWLTSDSLKEMSEVFYEQLAALPDVVLATPACPESWATNEARGGRKEIVMDSRRSGELTSVAHWWALGASDAMVTGDTTYGYSAWLRAERRYGVDAALDLAPAPQGWERFGLLPGRRYDPKRIGPKLPMGTLTSSTVAAVDAKCRHMTRSPNKIESDRW